VGRLNAAKGSANWVEGLLELEEDVGLLFQEDEDHDEEDVAFDR